MKINIQKLAEYLTSRPIVNDTDCDAKLFWVAFNEFVEHVFNGTLVLFDNKYADWIADTVKRRSTYRHFNTGDCAAVISKGLKKDVDLCMNIRDKGMHTPIVLYLDPYYAPYNLFDIDGWHRLAICNVLGHDTIPYTCADSDREKFMHWFDEFHKNTDGPE